MKVKIIEPTNCKSCGGAGRHIVCVKEPSNGDEAEYESKPCNVCGGGGYELEEPALLNVAGDAGWDGQWVTLWNAGVHRATFFDANGVKVTKSVPISQPFELAIALGIRKINYLLEQTIKKGMRGMIPSAGDRLAVADSDSIHSERQGRVDNVDMPHIWMLLDGDKNATPFLLEQLKQVPEGDEDEA